jgi:NitT/TauT family transport system ATP-binding protein
MTAAMTITFDRVGRFFERADGQVFKAVDDVSLSIAAGEFVCLVGPSGCGKTTLLQMIAGLLAPSQGTIAIGDRPIVGPGPDRGVVFQKDSVFPWMTVIRNIEYGLKCRGMAKSERMRIARRYLDMVGLSHVERSWPRELSGGMLKRVAVAAVFANGGSVLLLDEPFGALDYVTRHQLHDVLMELWDERRPEGRRTVIFVTHDVDEALTLADRVLVFRSGRQVDDLAVGAPRPRSTDSLLRPDMVAHRHTLLAHLGLEHSHRGARQAESA